MFITLDKFVEEVRNELCILGLPLNWQPDRRTISAYYYNRRSVSDCVAGFKSQVARYEAYVNKPTI